METTQRDKISLAFIKLIIKQEKEIEKLNKEARHFLNQMCSQDREIKKLKNERNNI